MWSYSASRLFLKCQRQWFYKNIFGHHKAKDPKRQEAYLLSKLQSLEAWRGSLVDSVISEQIIPALNRRASVDLTQSLNIARRIFERQLEFGLNHRIRESGMKPSKALSAFHAIEYRCEITNNNIEKAWTDIETSLANFFKMEGLIKELRRANYLISQRALQFRHFQDIPVKAYPDLIGFFRNEPPLIIDWKVNTAGTRDHRFQLAIYSVALARCYHSDFPDYLLKFEPTDYRLLEVQLLTNQQKKYNLSEKDIERVDSYIFSTATRMNLARGNNKSKFLSPPDFPVTNYPDVCQSCSFIALCREVTE